MKNPRPTGRWNGACPVVASLLLAGTGCSDGGSLEAGTVRADVQALVEAAESPQLEQALSACRSISDAASRALCVADLPRRFDSESPGALQAACSTIDHEVWRGECFFFVAETLAAKRNMAPAIRACANADPYTANCVMHLWAEQGRHLVRTEKDLQAAVEAFEQALSWAERAELRADARLMRDAWVQFFQEVLKGRDPIDTAPCEPLGEDARDSCTAAARRLLVRNLNGRVRRMEPAEIEAVCAQAGSLSTAEVTALLGVRYESTTDLEATAARLLKRFCRPFRTHREPPPSPPSSPPPPGEEP